MRLRKTHRPLACVALALLPGPVLPADEPSTKKDAESETAAALQLLDVDKHAEDRMREIAQWVQEKRYDEAEQALHALMTAEAKPPLYPRQGDSRQYGTTTAAAAGFLATAPEELLDLYCKRHDLAAGNLFEESRRKLDESALRSVGERYFHTPHGGRALALAAALAFDTGDHLAAAALWERLYREHRRPPADRATLLAKAAAAYHLGGLRQKAAALLQQLKEHHAASQALVSGQKTSLAACLEKALAGKAEIAVPPVQPVGDWLSLAGSPRSVAVAAAADPTPVPIRSEGEAARRKFLEELFGAGAPADRPTVSVAQEGGWVRFRRLDSGQPPLTFALSPLIHPVTLQGMVLCRREAAVVATSLESGLELWRTRGLPMHGEGEGLGTGLDLLSAVVGDMGRYALTLGDGKVYTVCKFNRMGRHAPRQGGGERAAESDGASLVALHVNRDGAEAVWEIGNGKGGHELLRQAKVLAAPTFCEGRLYVLARQENRYHAMCLDAAHGTLLWETPLGLVPMRGGAAVSWQQACALEATTERGSPPAVADGMAFFTTNAGVIVALAAATGAPVWAHQYDSHVSGPALGPSTVNLQGQTIRIWTQQRPCWPVNPLIVAQGRVVCLPCDSNVALALDTQTGQMVWQLNREEQQDLTALDDSTLLLSGPGLLILRLRDGSVQRRCPGRLLGRPAVTSGAVFASGEGSIVRFDLARGVLEELQVAGTDAVLGRMLLAGGRLVAANAAGLSIYADYDTAWRAARTAFDQAKEASKRAALALSAGRLALFADRLDDAAAQLTAAAAEARKADDAKTGASARSLLCETRLRQFRAAGAKEDAIRYLDQAAPLAAAPAEREQVLLERVRYHERLGRPGEAARCAQAAVARQADPWRTGAAATLQEYILARRELARLILDHGETVYAPFETELSGPLDQALAKQNPDDLVAVFRRWPCSRRSGAALLTAADILVREAVSASPPGVELAMKASRILSEASQDFREETRLNARAAKAVIDLRFRPLLAGVVAAELSAAPPAIPVRFGGFSGTVGDLIAQAKEIRQRPLPPTDPQFGALAFPLSLAYETRTGAVTVLCDASGEPVRLADRLFLCVGRDLTCLDTRLNDPENGKLWTLELPQRVAADQRVGQISADSRRLAVLDKGTLSVLDALSGKPLLQTRLDWLGPRGWTRAAGEGDWLALADEKDQIKCLKITDGQTLWGFRSSNFHADTLTVAQGLLFATDQGRCRHLCWDLRTGRLLAEYGGPGRKGSGFSAMLAPDGLVVTWDADGAVAVLDVRTPEGGEGRSVKLERAEWRWIGAGSRFVGLKPGAGAGGVRVLDLADIQRAIELKINDGAGQARQPVRMNFLGYRAILLYASEVHGEDLTAPGLAAFELPGGRKIWDRALAPAASGPCRVTKPSLYGDLISLAVTSRDGSQPTRRCVVAVAAGELFDCSTVADPPRPSSGAPGNPVVLNGRVLVSDPAGLICLVSAKP
jgi:outer membrane protein assembly factor BamB